MGVIHERRGAGDVVVHRIRDRGLVALADIGSPHVLEQLDGKRLILRGAGEHGQQRPEIEHEHRVDRAAQLLAGQIRAIPGVRVQATLNIIETALDRRRILRR